MFRRYTVTIYVDHHAVANVHNLTRLGSIRLMKQLMGAELNLQRFDQIAGKRVRTR